MIIKNQLLLFLLAFIIFISCHQVNNLVVDVSDVNDCNCIDYTINWSSDSQDIENMDSEITESVLIESETITDITDDFIDYFNNDSEIQSVCGDKKCASSQGENCQNCPNDCKCSSSSICVAPGVCCEPDCSGLECGPDGCGSVCGFCENNQTCENGKCIAQAICGNAVCEQNENCASCALDCTCPESQICNSGKCISCADYCSINGTECGFLETCDCGMCDNPLVCADHNCECPGVECNSQCCQIGSNCWLDQCCKPDCSNVECGYGNCGQLCGTCKSGYQCAEGSCLYAPLCGNNKCDQTETCTNCPQDCGCKKSQKCIGNKCVSCSQLCIDAKKECGFEGQCNCGECKKNEKCNNYKCFCPNQTCGNKCCNLGEICFDNQCCKPDCTGKECGDDGCGGSCGECVQQSDQQCSTVSCSENHVCVETAVNDGALCDDADLCSIMSRCKNKKCTAFKYKTCFDKDMCTKDVCDSETGECKFVPLEGACSWKNQWMQYKGNPILVGKWENSDAEQVDMSYPSVLKVGKAYRMWYSAPVKNNKSQIFMALSKDLTTWNKYPSLNSPQPVLENNYANLEAPNVIKTENNFYMYYTQSSSDEQSEIVLGLSKNGIHWETFGPVLSHGDFGSWDSEKVRRASVVKKNNKYMMWYEGQNPGWGWHLGYATSDDGKHFTKFPGNPVVLYIENASVTYFNNLFVMLSQGGDGVYYAISDNGYLFKQLGRLFDISGKQYDSYGDFSPFLFVKKDDETGQEQPVIFFAGAISSCKCKKQISIATLLKNPLSGCSKCLTNFDSCQQFCNDTVNENYGFCYAPESSNPSQCCMCSNGFDCINCLGGFLNCNQECIFYGHQSGQCEYPNSTDPDHCCSCN